MFQITIYNKQSDAKSKYKILLKIQTIYQSEIQEQIRISIIALCTYEYNHASKCLYYVYIQQTEISIIKYHMEKKQFCPSCKIQYSETNIPRLIPTCGHTLCQSCIKTQLKKKTKTQITIICPEDAISTILQDDDIRNFPKNFALIKMLNQQKKGSRVSSKKGSQKDLKKQNITQAKEKNNKSDSSIEKQNDLQTKDDFICQPIIDSKKQQKKKTISNNLEQMCLIHDKPFQIICIQDKTKICSNCAIFGQHRGHNFKTIEEFERDKLKKCENILSVVEQKQKIHQQITENLQKDDSLRKVHQKKEALKKSIKDNYLRLAECLNLSQKKTMAKLNSIVNGLQQKVKAVVDIEVLLQKYQTWERQAFSQIQIFESQRLQDHLRLINYSKTNKDIVTEGKIILEQLKEDFQKAVTKKEEMINSLSIEYKTELDLRIMDYCNIYIRQETKSKVESHLKLSITQPQDPFPLPVESNVRNTLSDHLRKTSIFETLQKNSIKPYFNTEPGQDLLLEEFKTQQAEKFNRVKGSYLQQKSLDQISSIDDLSRRTSRDISALQSLQNSFIIFGRSGAKTPLGQKKMNRQTITKGKKLKLPDKYQRVFQGIVADTLQVVDFTNAELGDQLLLQVLQFLPGRKCKTLKLIRNKLSDQALDKMWMYFYNIIHLNLSQNLLTERTIESLLYNLPRLPNLRSITLSQNKIKQRSVKNRVQEIKRHDIVVSL